MGAASSSSRKTKPSIKCMYDLSKMLFITRIDSDLFITALSTLNLSITY